MNLVKGFKVPFRCRQAVSGSLVYKVCKALQYVLLCKLFSTACPSWVKSSVLSLSALKCKATSACMTTGISLTSFPLAWLALPCGCETSLLVFQFHPSQTAVAISTGMKLTLQDSLISTYNGCILTFQEGTPRAFIFPLQFHDIVYRPNWKHVDFVENNDPLRKIWNWRFTSIQIYTMIPKYQVAACKQLLWRYFSGFANTFNFSSKRQ